MRAGEQEIRPEKIHPRGGGRRSTAGIDCKQVFHGTTRERSGAAQTAGPPGLSLFFVVHTQAVGSLRPPLAWASKTVDPPGLEEIDIRRKSYRLSLIEPSLSLEAWR